MSTYSHDRLANPTVRRWGGGALGGLAGGIPMGIVMTLLGVMPFVGALYGNQTLLGGWLAHLLNSVLFGLAFVAAVTRPFLRDIAADTEGCLLLGLGFGALLEMVFGGLVLPLAVTASGVASLPATLLAGPGLAGFGILVVGMGVAHLVYGATLGWVYATVRSSPVALDARAEPT